MIRKTPHQLFLPLMGCILVVLLLQSQTVMASSTWTEDFNNGLPEDWSVSHGVVVSHSGYVEVTNCVTILDVVCFASLWADHDEITGTWTIDYYRNSSETSEFAFHMAATGQSTVPMDGFTGGWPDVAYCVVIGSNAFFQEQDLPELRLGMVRGSGACVGQLINDFNLPQGRNEIIVNYDGETLYLTINNEKVANYTITDQIESAEQINVAMSAGDRLEKIQYSNGNAISIGPFMIPLLPFLLVTFGVVGLVAFALVRFRKMKQKHLMQSKQAKQLSISQSTYAFELTDIHLLTLLGLGSRERNIHNEIKPEILSYRFLLHPVRLMIMKIVHDHSVIQSAEIRSQLGIKWGDYGQHLKSLEEKNYVMVNDQFADTSIIVKSVEITHYGNQEYETLIELLRDIVNEDSAIASIIDGGINNLSDELYPTESE